jgi:hypothetical protein
VGPARKRERRGGEESGGGGWEPGKGARRCLHGPLVGLRVRVRLGFFFFSISFLISKYIFK